MHSSSLSLSQGMSSGPKVVSETGKFASAVGPYIRRAYLEVIPVPRRICTHAHGITYACAAAAARWSIKLGVAVSCLGASAPARQMNEIERGGGDYVTCMHRQMRIKFTETTPDKCSNNFKRIIENEIFDSLTNNGLCTSHGHKVATLCHMHTVYCK